MSTTIFIPQRSVVNKRIFWVQCQSSTDAAWSSDVYERLSRHIQTYVSIAEHKDGKDVSRQKEDLMSFQRCQYYPRVLSRNESFASDIRASFRWKNIYSTAMERRNLPILVRDRRTVSRGRVCAHQRSLLGFAANEKPQSAWSDERTRRFRESENDTGNEI